MELVQFLLNWNHGVDQKKACHSWVTYGKVNLVV